MVLPVYMAEAFRRACRALGISVQPARPYTPTDKAIVERTFGSINTLFCQHINGYVGGNVTMRGKDPGADAVFTVAQLQDLFDEWVVGCGKPAARIVDPPVGAGCCGVTE